MRLFGLFSKSEQPSGTIFLDSLKDIKIFERKNVIKQIKKLTSDGWGGENALELTSDSVVYMRPHNTGMPTCPFVWYSNRNGAYVKVLDNQNDFTQISNLNDILNQATGIMRESYGSKIPVLPFDNFGILLTDPVHANYTGQGELVFLTGDFLKKGADEREASIYFANDFLDLLFNQEA